MDDRPEQNLPQEGEALEAAAALAELATALADADADAGADTSPATPAAEPPTGRLERLRGRIRLLGPQLARPIGRQLRRLVAALMASAVARTSLHRAVAVVLATAMVLIVDASAPVAHGPVPAPSRTPIAAASHSSGHGSPTSAASPLGAGAVPELTGGPADTSVPTHKSAVAAITFSSLMLDSTLGLAPTARTFSFTSDGVGTVSASIVATSPTDSTTMCLKVDLEATVCQSGATPEFMMQAKWAHSHWTVALISANEGTPTVDVAFSWPTDNPSISLTHGRFQGAPNPDSLRSITATFKARTAGGLVLQAAWQPAAADATVTLTDISGKAEAILDKASYANASEIATQYQHGAEAAHTYRITLYNQSTGISTAELKATIAFP